MAAEDTIDYPPEHRPAEPEWALVVTMIVASLASLLMVLATFRGCGAGEPGGDVPAAIHKRLD